MLDNDAIYFDSSVVEHIPKEFRCFFGNKNMETNIFRIQSYDSVMCWYFCIRFIDCMHADQTLIDYTSLFSLHDFEKNEKIILVCIKMDEAPSMYPNLNKHSLDQIKSTRSKTILSHDEQKA